MEAGSLSKSPLFQLNPRQDTRMDKHKQAYTCFLYKRSHTVIVELVVSLALGILALSAGVLQNHLQGAQTLNELHRIKVFVARSVRKGRSGTG